MEKAIYVLFMMLFMVVNIFIFTQNIYKEDNIAKEKYEMVIVEDESKEFMSIRFIKINR